MTVKDDIRKIVEQMEWELDNAGEDLKWLPSMWRYADEIRERLYKEQYND